MEVKTINGYDIKDETGRNLTNDIKNKSEYYEEVTYTKERHHDTDCYFITIPKYDNNSNEILLYIGEVSEGSSPTQYARDNYTTLTTNATLKIGGTIGNASVISNGEIIRDADLSSTIDTYVYLGIKENRVLKQYQGNQTSAQDMLDDGCLQAFLVYYPILENSEVLDMSEVVTGDPGVPTERHPRQCLGQKSDGTIIMLSCDGRTKINAGLTSEETAELLLAKGCVNAWNLDGGGSTSTTIKGSKLNRNIDGNGTKDRFIAYTLNVKKDTFNPELAKVYSKIGEEKQNVIEQLIPYINDLYSSCTSTWYTGVDLDTMIGKTMVCLLTNFSNGPDGYYSSGDYACYFINIPHASDEYKDLYNVQFYIRRDYNEVWTRRQVNGVFTDWWCLGLNGKALFKAPGSANIIAADNTYQDVVFSTTITSNNSIIKADTSSVVPNTDGKFTKILVDRSGFVNVRVSGVFHCNSIGKKYIKLRFGDNDSGIYTFDADSAGDYMFNLETMERITAQTARTFGIQIYGSTGDSIYRCHTMVELDR